MRNTITPFPKEEHAVSMNTLIEETELYISTSDPRQFSQNSIQIVHVLLHQRLRQRLSIHPVRKIVDYGD
jgi:hypothetical protein